MNRLTNEQLDRLVDGELTTEEQRELFELLERDPQGWRRCAIAFLEAQAWQAALSETTSSKPPMVKSSQQAARVSSRWSSWMAIAAAIVLAFALGVASERQPSGKPDRVAAVNNDNIQTPPEAVGSNPNDSITLVVDGADGKSRQVEVPILNDEARKEWIMRDAEGREQQFLLEQVRRSGRRVQSRNRFWAPVELEDGNRFVVPVERWQLSPASHRQFQ